MKHFGILLIVALIALATSTADGALIASFDFDGGGGSRGLVSGIGDIELSYELPSSELIISTTGLLEPADIGQSFDLTGSDLADIIALLTNGDDDTLRVSIDGGGRGRLESVWFDGNSNLTGPDLVGFNLERVAVVLNSLTLDSPGTDPNRDGNWTDYDYNLTFNFYTVIPEPTTLALLALGGGVALLRRRKAHSTF